MNPPLSRAYRQQGEAKVGRVEILHLHPVVTITVSLLRVRETSTLLACGAETVLLEMGQRLQFF